MFFINLDTQSKCKSITCIPFTMKFGLSRYDICCLIQYSVCMRFGVKPTISLTFVIFQKSWVRNYKSEILENEIGNKPAVFLQMILLTFPIKDFFSKCDQIYSFLQIWSHLLKKSSV